MQIKVLGCSGGVGPGLRTTSLLVDGRVLVDAGTGACDLDLDGMACLSDVFLTHSHLDHVVGAAFIADNRFACQAPPLALRAPVATLAALRKHLFNWVLWPDFTELLCRDAPVLQPLSLDIGVPVELPGLLVTAFPVLHTVPAVGYALQGTDQRCFAFTGDTYADPAMWQALNALPRLDALMIEVAYADELAEVGRLSRHLTPTRLAQQLAELRHRPRLLLSHPKPGQQAAIEAQCRPLLAAWDYRHLQRGDVIDL